MATEIPLHVVRYEDITGDTYETLKGLFEFIMTIDDLEGTQMGEFIRIASNEASPQHYKPRSGKVNKNLDKYGPEGIKYIYNYAETLINQFNYQEHYLPTIVEGHVRDDDQLAKKAQITIDMNKVGMSKAKQHYFGDKKFTPVRINFSEDDIRQNPSETHPQGTF